MAHQKRLTITIQCDSISTAERLLDPNEKPNASNQGCQESELDVIFKTLHVPALGTFGRTHQSLNTITYTYPNPTEVVRRHFSRIKRALHHPKGIKKVGKHGIEIAFFESEEYNAWGYPSRHCTFANVKPIVKSEPLDAPPIPPAVPLSAVSLAPIGMSRRVATCPPGSSTWHAGRYIPSHAAHAAERPKPSPLSPAMMVGLSTCNALPGTQTFTSPSECPSFFAPMFRSTTSTTNAPPLPSRRTHHHQFRPYPPPRATYTLSTTEGPDPSANSFPLTPVSPRYQPAPHPIVIAASPRFEPCSPPYRPTSPGLRYDTPPFSCAGVRQVAPPTDHAQGESRSPSAEEAIDLEPWRRAYNHNSGVSEQYDSGRPSAQHQQSFEEESQERRGEPSGCSYYHPDVEVLKDAAPIRSTHASRFRSGASPVGRIRQEPEVMGLGLSGLDSVPSSQSSFGAAFASAPSFAAPAVPTSLLWPASSATSSSYHHAACFSSFEVPSQVATTTAGPTQWTTQLDTDSQPYRLGSAVSLLSPLNLGSDYLPDDAPQATFQLDFGSASPFLPHHDSAPVQPSSGLEDVDVDSSLFLPPGLELGAEKVYRGYGYGTHVDVVSPASSTPDFLPPGLELGVQREYGIHPLGMDMFKEGPVHPRTPIGDDGGVRQPVMTIKRPRLEDLVVAGKDTRKAKRTGGRGGQKPYDRHGSRRRQGSESLEESGDDSDISSSSTSTTTSGSSTSTSSSSACSLSSSSSTRTRGSRRSSLQYDSVALTDAELLKRLRKAESAVASSNEKLKVVKRSLVNKPRTVGDRDKLEHDVRKMGKKLDKLQQEYRLILDLCQPR
ncbi:hypothetical protein MD484_g2314, partial [Candolleomyces efflorescens]